VQFDGIQKDLKDSNLLDKTRQFLKGGFWRNFFIRYPEANDMHKKMLFISNKINGKLDAIQKDSEKRRLLNAREHVWAGQCNCAYWHGVFGGVYTSYLRNGLYSHIIKAEDALAGAADDKTTTEVIGS